MGAHHNSGGAMLGTMFVCRRKGSGFSFSRITERFLPNIFASRRQSQPNRSNRSARAPGNGRQWLGILLVLQQQCLTEVCFSSPYSMADGRTKATAAQLQGSPSSLRRDLAVLRMRVVGGSPTQQASAVTDEGSV